MRVDKQAPRRMAVTLIFLLATIFPLSAQQKSDCIVRVTLLQVNDVYQFAPVDQGAHGGIARVLTLKKEIQKQSPHTLLLLSGDTISPSVESITYQGAQMIDAWNAAELDYATFGNHEFDFGPDVLRQRMKESNFKWIVANVIDRKTGKPFGDAPPFVIREFDGVKIGIFGLTLEETKVTSRPGPDVEFLNPCETARKTVAEIHARGVKTVIALTHLSMSEDKQVARCADVDVIIGGHEHTLLESAAGGTPIFKMTADGRELGQIDLNISRSTGSVESIDWKVIPVTRQIKEDQRFAAIYRKYGALLKELSQFAGRTAVELDARSAAGRTQETNIGDFIADAFRTATGADVGLMNGGSIRADEIIRSGPLTKRDVLSILPFKNKVVKLALTGATLRQALEHGVARSAEDAEPGRFPQVSGIRFTFDATRPPGSRIVDLTINGRPLDEKKTYTLATTDYVAIDGGDGYSMLKSARLLIPREQAQFDSEILRAAIASKKIIAPKTDGRIKRLDKDQKQKSDCN
ncbi:MAG TPA: bifunctional metallophosphatase/5'-nucleotidase [Blastocatellia bacterium]|nr:bifunctional metallophosphatase/5'-nucleotidase [Blastocatellia bacterium]HAF22429.1 bifunctional metallophosphatase/5'-nucleotidase [Blastocatellia bacterium]